MHQQKLTVRLATTAVIAAIVLAFGIVWSGTGLASVGNSGSDAAAMAQKGKGNGNGNAEGGSAQNQEHGQDNGNQGRGNGQGVGAENQGNGNQGQDQGVEVQSQDASEAEDTADDGADDTADDGTEQEVAPAAAGKVGICHSTGNGGGVFITVSQNALPAHERHGDDTDLTSEADCEANSGLQARQGGPAATPGSGEEATGPAGATPGAEADEQATPPAASASPEAGEASPEAEEATPPGV